MTPVEKKRFIKNLCDDVARAITEDLPHLPPEWDGIELRHYIQEAFAYEDVLQGRRELRSRRVAYRKSLGAARARHSLHY